MGNPRLIGAVLGTYSNPFEPGTGAARGAALGGLFVASKQADAAAIRTGIIDNCLRSRGYAVRP